MLVVRTDTVRVKRQRLTSAGGVTVVWVLVVLGVLVGIVIMGTPSDAGCALGWLYVLAVVALFFVIMVGAH